MGFILTTKSGAVEGEEFVFGDGSEARIGRTSGNDVVVHDNETSRNHARVFETDEGCFVEDLGSANGTFLNGDELPKQEPSVLCSGDVISIGSGELIFSEQTTGVTGKSAPQEENTVIKSVEELEAERRAPSALAVAPRTPRKPVRQVSPAKPAPLAPAAKARAPAVRAPAARALASKAPAPKASLAKRKNPPEEMSAPVSAAERARQQREAQKSFFGKLHYAFSSLEPQKRRVVTLGLVSATLIVLLGVVFLVYKRGHNINFGNEPRYLVVGAQPLWDTFGWGKGVDWPNEDSKQFEFQVVAPGRVVAVIRYYAKDIASEEVDVLFNNVRLGFVPADTVEVQENELVVPPQLVRNGETNTLLFDNVHNPPGKETWRIWGVAAEIEPIPNFTSPEEARAEIARVMQNAQQSYDARNIAPINLYESWRAYRKAWLFAESLETKNTSEYEFILSKYRDVRRELDELCSKFILEFKRIYATERSYERIVGVLEEILRHFPMPDHPCHLEAKQALGGS